MFNRSLWPDIRLSSSADPYAANVILYLPLTDAITTSPYNGQAIPAGGNLNDYGVNNLGNSYIGQDIRVLTAIGSSVGGSLPASTYYIRVFGYSSAGSSTHMTMEVAITVTGSTSSINLSFAAPDPSGYHRVFFGTVQGAEGSYFQTAANATSFTLTTTTGATSAVMPFLRAEAALSTVTSNSGTRTQKWGRFSGSVGPSTAGANGRSPAIIFNHSSFNNITNGTGDFTIEFNAKIVGDGQTTTSGINLKTFPFAFVGAAVNQVTASITSPLNLEPGDGHGFSGNPNPQTAGTVVAAVGDLLEMGMTIGSHTPPGGFGFGVGPADGANRGYAAACASNEVDANSYVNRGFPAVPSGNTSVTTWGPYHIAVCREAGVVSIFLNGKKIYVQVGADEGGDGIKDTSSTWNWGTFKLNTLQVAEPTGMFGVNGNYHLQSGLFIGGSYTYSSYGYDDDLYLQHFRVTQGVARYSADFTPETIYTVSP